MPLTSQFDKYLNKAKDKVQQYAGGSPSTGQPAQWHPQQQQQPPPGQYYYPPPGPQGHAPPGGYNNPHQYYPGAPAPGQPYGGNYGGGGGYYYPPPGGGGGPSPHPGYGQQQPPPPIPPHPYANSPQPSPGPGPGQPYQQPPGQPYQQHQPQQQPPPLPQHPSTYGSSAPSHPPSNIYWRPTFSPTVPVSKDWHHDLGAHGWGNNEAQDYTASPANSFHTPPSPLHSSALILRAIASNNKTSFTSARLRSKQPLSRNRGFLSACLTLPSARGIWPAFWLLPKEPMTWPVDGEIDIAEVWDGKGVNHACLHWGMYDGNDWDRHRVVETEGMNGRGEVEFGLAWEQDERGLVGDGGGRRSAAPREPENGRGKEGQRVEAGEPGEWDRDLGAGRLVWYVDGKAVMKARVPPGTRRLSDWEVVLNVAMGGNVNGGVLPEDGVYDFVVHRMEMCEGPPGQMGGWERFERDWVEVGCGHPV